MHHSQCLKIPEKVAFNIASEASYVYIQKFIKNAKNGQFSGVLKTWSLFSNSVTRQVTFKIGQKMVEKAKIRESKRDILSNF